MDNVSVFCFSYKHKVMTSMVDGNFSVASLHNPSSFLKLSDSLLLISSNMLKRLRLVDLQKEKVSAIFISGSLSELI